MCFFCFHIGVFSYDSLNMDSNKSDEVGVAKPPMTSNGGGNVNSKLKSGAGGGSASSKDMIFRADRIDLKSLDIQLEKHLSRAWSRNVENRGPKEDWEIDLSKLDIKHVIAHGTYGTVFRGTYDNRDVAGEIYVLFFFSLWPDGT